MITIIFACGTKFNYTKESFDFIFPTFTNIPDGGIIDFQRDAPFITAYNFYISLYLNNLFIASKINKDVDSFDKNIKETLNFLDYKNNYIRKEFLLDIDNVDIHKLVLNKSIDDLEVYFSLNPDKLIDHIYDLICNLDIFEILQIIKLKHINYSLFSYLVIYNFYPVYSLEYIETFIKKRNILIEKILINYKYNLNEKYYYNLNNNYLICNAIRNYHFDIAKIFIKFGANINIQDEDDNSIFHNTKMEYLTFEHLNFACQNGFNINIKNKKGNNPFTSFIISNLDNFKHSDDEKLKIIKNFISLGSDFDNNVIKNKLDQIKNEDFDFYLQLKEIFNILD